MAEYFHDSGRRTGGYLTPRSVVAREELVDGDIGAAYADIAFNAAPADSAMCVDSKTAFRVQEFISGSIAARAFTEDATFRVRVRDSPEGGWRTLGSEVEVTAGAADADATVIFEDNIRAYELKVQVKYTSSDGGTADIDASFKQ